MHSESAVTDHDETIGRFIDGFHRHANPEQLHALPESTLLVPNWPNAVLHAIVADLQPFVKDSGWTHTAAGA